MSQPCCACGEKVFPTEKLVLNGKHFHKAGCAKCGVCGVSLTPANFASVSGDDSSQWTCVKHKDKLQPGASRPKELTYTTQPLSEKTGQAPTLKKASSATAERFAAFLRKNLQEEESKRFGNLASKLRMSFKKQTTKEVMTNLTLEKQRELATFIDDFRKESENPMANIETYPDVVPVSTSKSAAPSRMNRAIRSIKLAKPTMTTPTPAVASRNAPNKNGFQYSVTKPAKAQTQKKPGRISMRNLGVKEARAFFQKN